MAKIHISLDAVQVHISGGLVSIQTGEDPKIKVSIETETDMIGINPDDTVEEPPMEVKTPHPPGSLLRPATRAPVSDEAKPIRPNRPPSFA